MSTTRTSRAEKAADVLYRYMRARHRFKDQVERPWRAYELAGLIAEGKRAFDEIYIEPEARGKADDVYAALIQKKCRTIPFWDPQLVAAWSHYVISHGPLPLRPGARHVAKPVEPP